MAVTGDALRGEARNFIDTTSLHHTRNTCGLERGYPSQASVTNQGPVSLLPRTTARVSAAVGL